MGRYEIVSKNEHVLYQKECPTIILSSALTLDHEKNAIISQIKFQNLSSNTVKAAYIKIDCIGLDGESFQGIPEYVYMDLSVPANQMFGSSVPIYLPDNRTRKIKISCLKILFEDGSKWEQEGDYYYDNFPSVVKLQNILEPELYAELIDIVDKDRIKVDEICYPSDVDNIQLCACGKYKLNDDKECWYCGKDKNWWLQHISKEFLQEKYEERLERERIQKIEQEEAEREKQQQQAEIRKRIKRVTPVVSAIILIVIIVIIIVNKIVIPAQKYEEANSYKQEEKYDKAIEVYKELGEYKDSEEQLETTKELKVELDTYEYGLYLYNKKEYSDAISHFEKVSDFRDSKYYIGDCHYLQNDYQTALEYFESIEDEDKEDEINSKISECYYKIGVNNALFGHLDEAKQSFEKTDNEKAKEYIELIQSIQSEKWVGIYRRQDDNHSGCKFYVQFKKICRTRTRFMCRQSIQNIIIQN